MTDRDDSDRLPSSSTAWAEGLHAAEINLSKASLGIMNIPAGASINIHQAIISGKINIADVIGPRVQPQQLGLINIDVSKFRSLADTALGAQKIFATTVVPNLGFGALGLRTVESGLIAINTIARNQVHSLLAISAPTLSLTEQVRLLP